MASNLSDQSIALRDQARVPKVIDEKHPAYLRSNELLLVYLSLIATLIFAIYLVAKTFIM